MDSETFKEYLEKRYYDQLNYYEKSSGRNQKKYKNFQWVLIILSALTPVLAAIDSEKLNIQYVVVIVSAIVAILTTGLKTFQYQELWANYRATCEQLKPEIHYYNFNVGPYGMQGVDKEALFISRVETILDKEHQGWPPAKKIRDDRSLGEKENSGTAATNTAALSEETAN
jgi:hypothetical protein